LPQLKIFVLEHPALWIDAIGNPVSLKQEFLSLNEKSRSWIKINERRGERQGIYRVMEMSKPNCLLAFFVSESSINEEHPSIEKILSDEGCLPENVKIPSPVPRASKTRIFFDFSEGVCYAFSEGVSSTDSVFRLLESLNEDIKLPYKRAKMFEWKNTLVTRITEIAPSEGFTPYKVVGDLETVRVVAIGDLSNNEVWKRIEGVIDPDAWRTLAYAKSGDNGPIVFGFTKTRRKVLSIPEMDPGISEEELFNRLLEMRRLIEKALGCDIRQYCFPQQVLL